MDFGSYDNILDEIIYGTLYADIYNTCIMHDANVRRRMRDYVAGSKDKYYFPWINMEEHFTMLRETKDFQYRFHISESAYRNLVDILEYDITVDEERSRASTDGNTPIFKEMIACMGLCFMGG